MALATRCPNCQALFRVVADQLKLRGGLVRCGACRNVFDAISMLSYVDDATIAPAPAPSTAEEAAPLRSDIPVEEEGAAAAATPAPSPVASDESGATRSDENAGAAMPAESAAVPIDASTARDGVRPEEAEPPSGLEHVDAEISDERTAADAVADAVADAERNDAATPDAQPDEAGGAPYEWDAAAVHTRMATDGSDVAASSAAPAFMQSKRVPRGFSIVFGGGAMLLILMMLVQTAVVFRSEILVRMPQALPLLSQACRLFDCTATWPARSELLAVVGSELQAIPGTNVLELTAIVRNRAAHRQPLPAIELTLTDAANRTVVRKVFTPADYLAAIDDGAARLAAGLDAGAETTIRLAFEVQGQNTTGYGFLVYPFHL